MAENKSRSWVKKLVYGVGGAFVLFVMVALIVPFVVDVDQYRPQIEKTVNDQINGRLELGKLKLSLWGRILVKVNGVRLFDQGKNKVVSVEEAFFHIPFFSIFSGSPLITFKLEQPEIKVIKDRTGKLNVLSLMKEKKGAGSGAPGEGSAGGPGSTGTPAQSGSAKPAGKVELPAIAVNARLGIELTKAFVLYEDQQSGLTNQVRDLNVLLKDISLTRATELAIWADLDTRLGKTFTLHGPIRVDGKLDPDFEGAEFSKAALDLKVDLDGLEISIPGTFVKKEGIPTNLSGKLQVSKKDVAIDQLIMRVHNAEIGIEGRATNLENDSPRVDLKIQSNEIALKPWAELVPPMKDFELGGSLSLAALAKGPSDRLSYEATVKMKEWTAKAPKLKAKPVINGEIRVITDQIEKFLFTLKAPSNDLRVEGKLVSFSKPALTLAVRSNELDLDKLVEFPPPAQSEEGAGGSGSGGQTTSVKGTAAQTGTKSGAKATEDLDAKVGELRKNEMVRNASANITVGMKKVRVYGIDMTGIDSKFTLRNLKAKLERFKMNIWSGGIQLSSSVDLKPRQPTYTISNRIQGLDLKQAVTSQLALFENTVYGKLFFSMKGRGASFNTEAAKRRLDVKGNFRVLNAVFTSIDVGKMTTEALNGSIDKIAKKYPKLKSKKIKGLPNGESKYERVSSDFSISNGVFNAPNFVARSMPKQGVDLDGKTRVGLLDRSLNARWKVIDRYNLTKARDLSVNIAGTEVSQILASGKPKAVNFPVTVKGTLDQPKYSYGEVPGHFSKVVAKNTTGAAKSRAQQELKKRGGKALEQVKKKAPKKIQKKVGDALKKFGF